MLLRLFLVGLLLTTIVQRAASALVTVFNVLRLQTDL